MFGYYRLYFVMHKESLTRRKVLPFFDQTISLSNVTNRTLQIEKKWFVTCERTYEKCMSSRKSL